MSKKEYSEAELIGMVKKWDASAKRWQEQGQSILLAALHNWKKSGAVQPMIRIAEAFEAMEAKGFRKNSMRRWFEVVCKFTYDPKAEAGKRYTYTKTKFTMELAMVPKWYDALKEETYTPLDEEKVLETVLKRLKSRLADPKEGDSVHMDVVQSLEATLELARQAKTREKVA